MTFKPFVLLYYNKNQLFAIGFENNIRYSQKQDVRLLLNLLLLLQGSISPNPNAIF